MDDLFYWGNLILSYGVSGYVLLKFLFALFEPKYTRGIYFYLYLGFVISAIGVNRIDVPVLKSIYGILAIIIIGNGFFYSKSKSKLISVCLLFFLYIFIFDTISVLFFTMISGDNTEILRESPRLLFLSGLGNQVILLCFLKPMIQIMQKHKFDSISIQQSGFLILLALFQVFFINYILKIVDNTINSVVLMVLSTGFLGIDIYLIYLFDAISQKYRLENELGLMEQKESMQQIYYHNLEVQYDESRKIIHDMRNHIQIFEELYRSGNFDEAEKYSIAIYKMMDKMGSRFKASNKILTIIINEKLIKCDDKKIEMKIKIEDLSLDFLKPIDITTILSNLLDNAIEACECLDLEKRKIEIKIFKHEDFINIKIRNNCIGPLIEDSKGFKSTKMGHHMGIGLKNVISTIEKYNGDIQFVSKEDVFEVKILLSNK